MTPRATIESLPNEMLLCVLSCLPTTSVLALLEVKRRLHHVAVLALHDRLVHAAAVPDRRLILECYHPRAMISTPYLFCDYLRTDELLRVNVEACGAENRTSGDGGSACQGLKALKRLYSRFRPVAQQEQRWARASSNPAAAAQAGESPPAPDGEAVAVEELAPSENVTLDEGQLFAQLCTVINLVRVGPRPGLFLSHVNLAEGVVRVRRQWLATAAAATCTGDEDDKTAGEKDDRRRRPPRAGEAAHDPILWADRYQTVGLRFRVEERTVGDGGKGAAHAVLAGVDEEPPVSYRLEFEELLVRASKLLRVMERSEAQEMHCHGNAVIIASI